VRSGNDQGMAGVRELIEPADTTVTVLIRGGCRTRNEIVAQAVYACPSRRDKPFVKVNDKALLHTIKESGLDKAL
jgi:transcriptional regulator with GAF, ATPase, and Fis domain